MAFEKNDPRVPYNPDDSLKDEEFATAVRPQKLHRQLKNRHVAMIRYIPPSTHRSHPNIRAVSVVSSEPAFSSELPPPLQMVDPLVFCLAI